MLGWGQIIELWGPTAQLAVLMPARMATPLATIGALMGNPLATIGTLEGWPGSSQGPVPFEAWAAPRRSIMRLIAHHSIRWQHATEELYCLQAALWPISAAACMRLDVCGWEPVGAATLVAARRLHWQPLDSCNISCLAAMLAAIRQLPHGSYGGNCSAASSSAPLCVLVYIGMCCASAAYGTRRF